jgi:outer membrane protein assembly factor BamB
MKQSRVYTHLVYSVCLLCWAQSASALYADWPEFRGRSQNGVLPTSNTPVAWSETQNVRWFTPTKGLGWSSPIVIQDRIYLTSAVSHDEGGASLGGSQQLVLVCLDVRSGKELWSRKIFEQSNDAPKIHNKNSHASPTPLFHEGKLYIHYGHQGTACTDLEGTILWTNRDHSFPPTHGNGGSPIIVGDMLVFTCDGGSEPYTFSRRAGIDGRHRVGSNPIGPSRSRHRN